MTGFVDPVLYQLAAGLYDVESVRKAQANRLRILTATGVDSDGVSRGFGLAADDPAVAVLEAQVEALAATEKALVKGLEKRLRLHPLHSWVKAQNGLGDKTVGRLLGSLGDPYWHDLHDRPRSIGELFAFCGVAGPGQRKQRGQQVTWNPELRMRLWNIVQPIIKNRRSRYRTVYDAGRERYAEKLHTESCVRCGPKGKPAESGSPWSDGHKHGAAMRLVMREILRDLWSESRRLHGADEMKEAA